jgi:hypothetical protein
MSDGEKMKQKKSFYKFHKLENNDARSEFDNLFETDNIVDKHRLEQRESRER